jgi:cytochrome b561
MTPARSHVTRVLHLSLLLVVLHQLGTSLFMERPLPGDDPEAPMLAHQWIGTAGLVVVLLFWLWTLVRHASETGLSALVPWFSKRRLAALADDGREVLAALAQRRRPRALDALASAVHGLGLLTVSALAASGAAWWFVFEGTAMGGALLTAHSALGNLMWAYLIGHAGMAVVHQLIEGDVFARMFWLSARRSPSAAE